MTTRPAWLDPELFPFQSRFVEAGGARVHYVDEGDGPTLLMLHGNPTWSFLYRRMIPLLADRFRCVALDYPGFGLSEPPAGYGFTAAEHTDVVEATLRSLDLDDVTLVAQDWGGPIGLAVAARHPDRFSGLVVGNTWAWRRSDPSLRFFSELMGGDRTGELVSQQLNLFVRLLIPAGLRRRRLSPGERAGYRGPFPDEASREPIRMFPRELRTATALLDEAERGLAAMADRPALVVWGDRDIAFRERERRRFLEALPRHHAHVLAGAGHYWQDDAGEEAALVLRRWWDLRR